MMEKKKISSLHQISQDMDFILHFSYMEHEAHDHEWKFLPQIERKKLKSYSIKLMFFFFTQSVQDKILLYEKKI